MRILAFSDIHHSRNRAEALVAASADADLVIGAGDFCNMRQNLPEAMALFSGFAAPMVVVPGNAESIEELEEAALAGMTPLHGTGTKIGGLLIFGLGGAVPETPFGGWSWDISERDAEELLEGLLTRYIEAQVYQAVVENGSCEQAARMIAMKSATDNAGDLIDNLQLVYNKARQSAITQELSEIVGGAAAVS